MKSIMRQIERFCLKHPRFGIPNLMLYIVIGNAAVWLFGMMDTTGALRQLLNFSASAIFTQGQVWRLFSFVLVPPNIGFFVLITLYFYYFIGSTLEQQWGPGKFTIYYLAGMFFTILCGTLIWRVTGLDIPLTAIYINLSLFFSFATLFPETVVMLFFILPIKIKWLAIVNAVFFLAAIVVPLFGPFPVLSLLPIAAVLNYFVFCGGWLFDIVNPKRIKQKSNVVNYKRAAKKYNQQQAKKPYSRKCEVCGRTDADYPHLEFRFCSRCEGYHCFCIDHINNHVHFKK